MEKINHTIQPYYNKDSKILILGSFPSPKSRESGFYYGHPQNRFWKVLSIVLETDFPETISDRINLLHDNMIALWDVLANCRIKGASDSSITDFTVNPIEKIIETARIKAVFTTGATAQKLYEKNVYESTRFHAIQLPSTSPANCRFSVDDLVTEYNKIKTYLS